MHRKLFWAASILFWIFDVVYCRVIRRAARCRSAR